MDIWNWLFIYLFADSNISADIAKLQEVTFELWSQMRLSAMLLFPLVSRRKSITDEGYDAK